MYYQETYNCYIKYLTTLTINDRSVTAKQYHCGTVKEHNIQIIYLNLKKKL